MSCVKKVLLILLFLSGNYTLVFTQTNNTKFEYPKSTLMLSTPYLPHAIVTNGKQGFSFAFSYPGYFSYWGQASLYYTNSLGDSYFGSIGEAYIMLGVNKKIIKFSKSVVYLNGNVGTFGIGHLGSLGISNLQQITPKSKIEVVLDVYFNHGVDADMMVHDKTYSMGLLAGVNYTLDIIPNFLINLGIGLSLVKYRYMRDGDGFHGYKYVYISKDMEKYYTETGLYDLPKWDSRIIIPLGLTLSYHF